MTWMIGVSLHWSALGEVVGLSSTCGSLRWDLLSYPVWSRGPLVLPWVLWYFSCWSLGWLDLDIVICVPWFLCHGYTMGRTLIHVVPTSASFVLWRRSLTAKNKYGRGTAAKWHEKLHKLTLLAYFHTHQPQTQIPLTILHQKTTKHRKQYKISKTETETETTACQAIKGTYRQSI